MPNEDPLSRSVHRRRAPEIDSAQYETGIGPCLDAFRHQEVFRIDDTTKDDRWPPFSEAAAAHGIHSTVSLPLVANHEGLGALNLYSRSPAVAPSPGPVFAVGSPGTGWVAGSLLSRARAIGGKRTTDSRPAATRAAAVTGSMAPMLTPIWVAVTMNGSEVA